MANKKLNDDDMCFATIGLTADLDELCNEYRLAHYNSLRPCLRCPANCSTLPWTNIDDEDSCFALTYEPPADGAMIAAPNDHPIWQRIGLTIFSVLWDIMHGLDLGPTQHVCGNVLFDFVHNPNFGASVKERLYTVEALIRNTYKHMGVANRLDHLTLNMFSKEGSLTTVFPVLRVKANEGRHLLPVLLHLLLHDPRCNVEETAYVQYRKSCVTYLCRYYAIVDNPDYFLDDESVREAQKCVQGFLESYVWLTDWALTNSKIRWQMTIKFHYYKHSCDQLPYLNPKHASCYTPESYLGFLARIAHSSSYGKPAYSWGTFIMRKLLMVSIVRKRRL